MILYSNKAFMNFQDVPNSHVPAINLLEFVVHALSIRYDSRENLQSMPVNAIVYLQEILSICW